MVSNLLPNKPLDLEIIPNFTQIVSEKEFAAKVNGFVEKKTIDILFARRFFGIRGIDLMIKLSEMLMEKYSDKITITFAGEGPRINDVIN